MVGDNGTPVTPDWVPDTCRCPGKCHTCIPVRIPTVPVAVSIWDSEVPGIGEN